MQVLTRDFFERETTIVAQELLGKILARKLDGSVISGRIVEVEAYLPYIDQAAHSFVGKTKRNSSLFENAGTLYVHQIHQHFCIDIVTESYDKPGSVLIRALEPLSGIELMRKFRQKEKLIDLTTGPGKLSKALGIDKSMDGMDITLPNSLLMVFKPNEPILSGHIMTSTRVGISKSSDLELRFYLKDNPFVSR